LSPSFEEGIKRPWSEMVSQKELGEVNISLGIDDFVDYTVFNDFWSSFD
jgi:hypothetical protein